MALNLDMIYPEIGMNIPEILHDLKKNKMSLSISSIKNHFHITEKLAYKLYPLVKELDAIEKKAELKAKKDKEKAKAAPVKKVAAPVKKAAAKKTIPVKPLVKPKPTKVSPITPAMIKQAQSIAIKNGGKLTTAGIQRELGVNSNIASQLRYELVKSGHIKNKPEPKPIPIINLAPPDKPVEAPIPIIPLHNTPAPPLIPDVPEAKAALPKPNEEVAKTLKNKYVQKDTVTHDKNTVKEVKQPVIKRVREKVNPLTTELIEEAQKLAARHNGHISVVGLQREFHLSSNWAAQLRYDLIKRGFIKPKEKVEKATVTGRVARTKIEPLHKKISGLMKHGSHRHRHTKHHHRRMYHAAPFDFSGAQQTTLELFNNNPFIHAGLLGMNLAGGAMRGLRSMGTGLGNLLPHGKSKEEKHLAKLEKESEKQTKILQQMAKSMKKREQSAQADAEGKLDRGRFAPNLFLMKKKDREKYEAEHGITRPSGHSSSMKHRLLESAGLAVAKMVGKGGVKALEEGAHVIEKVALKGGKLALEGIGAVAGFGAKKGAKLAKRGTGAVWDGAKKAGKGIIDWLKNKLGKQAGKALIAEGIEGAAAEGAEVGAVGLAEGGAAAVGGIVALPEILGLATGALLAYGAYKTYEWVKTTKPDIGKTFTKLGETSKKWVSDVSESVKSFFSISAKTFTDVLGKFNYGKFGDMINDFIEKGLAQAQAWINDNTKGGLNSSLTAVRKGISWTYDEGKSLLENSWNMIKKHEGSPNKPYWDVDGWSYPGGLHIPGGDPSKPPPPLPKSLIESKEKGKVQEALNFAASHIDQGKANQQQLVALADLFYNTGTGYGTKKTKWKEELFDDINRGDLDAAAKRIQSLNRDVKGNIIPGISARRNTEAAPFVSAAQTNLASNNSGQSVYDASEQKRIDTGNIHTPNIVFNPSQNTNTVNQTTQAIMAAAPTRSQEDSLRIANTQNFDRP